MNGTNGFLGFSCSSVTFRNVSLFFNVLQRFPHFPMLFFKSADIFHYPCPFKNTQNTNAHKRIQ